MRHLMLLLLGFFSNGSQEPQAEKKLGNFSINSVKEQQVQSTTDQFQFVTDEVNVIIHECLENVLGDKSWDGNKQEQWNNKIMECILEKMCDFKKPYKYIVQCTTVQRAGCVVDVASECYWDQTTDGSCTVRWENPDILAVVSVFGIFI